MSSLDTELIDALASNRVAIVNVEKDFEEKIAALNRPYKEQLEALLEKRQPLLDATPGLWSKALAAPSAPTRELLNETIDPKLLRVVASLRVRSKFVGDSQLHRTVTITLQPNIFTDTVELSREINSSGESVAVTPIAWKVPERVRTGSLFTTLFDASTPIDDVVAAVEAVDQVFQNPQLFIES